MRPLALRLERAFYLFAALAWISRLAFEGGAPRWLLDISLGLAALSATAAVLLTSEVVLWLDRWRLGLALLGLFFFPTVYGRVGGDGFEYYALLRSPLFDGDLDFANDYAGLGARPVRSLQGEITSRFPIGTAVLWAPFVLAAHLVASVLYGCGLPVVRDGFSPLYQTAATTATYLYGLVALGLLEGAIRRRHGAPVAFLTVLSVWLATPLHFYLVATPSMAHGVSAFAATVFVLSWLRARSRGRGRDWALAGLAGGLMILVRGQDAVLLLLPLMDILMGRTAQRLQGALAFGAGPAVMALIQISIWWWLYGTGMVPVVRKSGHLALHEPHLLDLLFAARHGLLTWTPLYAAALVGWLIGVGRERVLSLLFTLGFVGAALVNSTQWDWWGGDSFGQRRMLSLTPLFAMGVAETLAFLRRRPLALPAATAALLVLWNLQFIYIYNSDLVSGKGQAVSLDRLVSAQADVAYRTLLRWEHHLPRPLFVLAYDNLKGIWLDEGPRSLGGKIDLGDEPPDLPVVVGGGWYEPDREAAESFRCSRSLRSWVRLPINTLADLEVTLRCRRGVAELPVEVTVLVNDQAVGTFSVPAEWSEASVRAPRALWRRGFNDLKLVYSATPRAALVGYHGKDCAIALDWVSVKRHGSLREAPPLPPVPPRSSGRETD